MLPTGLLGTGRSMFGAGYVLSDYGQGLCYIIVCYVCVNSMFVSGRVVLLTSRECGGGAFS